VSFNVRVPLARGFGRKDVAAEETAAQLEYAASRLDLQHLIANRLLNTASGYWNYLGATRRVQIVTRAEQYASTLLTKTIALVKANEVPAAETNQLVANLADKTVNRIAAEQGLFEARQALGLAIGMSFAEFAALAAPVDDFPEAGDQPALQDLTPQGLIEPALTRRADVQAAGWREKAARTLSVAALRRLKPRVDLIMQVGYAGAESGGETRQFFSAFAEHVEGVNALAGFTLAWPPANNAAKGILLQRESISRATAINAEDLRRNVSANVALVLEQLRSTFQELNRTAAAIREYEAAVRNEDSKRQLGFSTFINVLVLEDRLTNAELNHLAARIRYAILIVRFRYEIGAMISPDVTGERIVVEDLMTIPRGI